MKKIHLPMKNNSTFTSFLIFVITVLLFTISILLTSCSEMRYTYFNKQKVPYTVPGETKLAKAVPAKPFLTRSENELKEKNSLAGNKDNAQKKVTENSVQKKAAAPATMEQIFNDINIAKFVPKDYKGIQSQNSSNDDDHTLLVVLLIVLILVVISLLGDGLLWLIFLALLILLIYFLVKYLGIFN